jgi:hypothetical protein
MARHREDRAGTVENRCIAPLVLVHAEHEGQHDDGHRRTHDQRHPRPGLAEMNMCQFVGIQIHQAEHDERGTGDHPAKAGVSGHAIPRIKSYKCCCDYFMSG